MAAVLEVGGNVRHLRKTKPHEVLEEVIIVIVILEMWVSFIDMRSLVFSYYNFTIKTIIRKTELNITISQVMKWTHRQNCSLLKHRRTKRYLWLTIPSCYKTSFYLFSIEKIFFVSLILYIYGENVLRRKQINLLIQGIYTLSVSLSNIQRCLMIYWALCISVWIIIRFCR